MTTKQILLSALILGTTAQVTLAMNQKELNENFLKAAHDGNLRQIEQLLKNRADINTKDKDGCTALHATIRYPNISSFDDNNDEQIISKIISKLIDNGIDYDAQDRWGNTAAHIAAQKCNYQILRLMHKKNVDLAKENNLGETPSNKAYKSREEWSPRPIIGTLEQMCRIDCPERRNYCQISIDFLEEVKREKAQLIKQRNKQIEQTIDLSYQ